MVEYQKIMKPDEFGYKHQVFPQTHVAAIIGIKEYLEKINVNGIPGKDGINGRDGINGLSAYQIALINGFNGTQADWLNSLKGKPGNDLVSNVRIYYDITKYGAKPFDMNFDNGAVINQIIDSLPDYGGTILIPSGDFWLTTPIRITKNYVRIYGMNSGFRSNIDSEVGQSLSHPGAGSHLLLRPELSEGIVVGIKGKTPRISGIEISRINMQGARERGATVSQVLVDVIQDNDGFKINDCVLINANVGLIIHGGDAPVIKDNWICEMQNSVQLLDSSQQALIRGNHLGAQPTGFTLKLDSPMCANISGNNIYPDGISNIEINNGVMCSIVGNNLQSFYAGMINLNGGNNNLIASNMIYARSNNGKWVVDPIKREGKYGVIIVRGDANTITSNHIVSEQPVDDTRINIASGNDNVISNTTIRGNASKSKVVVNGSGNNNLVINSAFNTEFDNGGNTSNRNNNFGF